MARLPEIIRVTIPDDAFEITFSKELLKTLKELTLELRALNEFNKSKED